jgi:mRNA interferase MazF
MVIQGDALNRSRIATVLCVPLTSNLRWTDAPRNALLGARITGLPRHSVANVSQLVTFGRDALNDCVGKLPRAKLQLIFAGIDVILGR